MDRNSMDTATKKVNPPPAGRNQPAGKGPEKHKKHVEDDTKNSGFRSSRIRNAESRTQDSGDPSIP